MIATNVRRLGLYLMLAFGVVTASITWWQVVEAQNLAVRPDNPEVIAARRTLPRGSIWDLHGQLLASSEVVDGLSRRTYPDPAFTHVIGYSSLRFGSTGLERAYEDLLVGQTDPNPIRDIVNDILDRQPMPRDLSLTIDQRLQDFAAAAARRRCGGGRRARPATPARSWRSSRRRRSTRRAISGDPATAQEAMDALRNDPAEPLLGRARQGLYVPGSIMKVFTGSSGLDAGVITPSTTFPDQPAQEIDGFLVDGFPIREHDLGGIRPDLWALSEALQVSSNIYFAHVGLELGADEFLDYARRFGFCEPMAIGPAGRALGVAPSYVTAPVDRDCGPFGDNAELASAAFGQGLVQVTPVQMAMVAAAIAGDGVMPQPWVVGDVRTHAEGTAMSDSVLQTFGSLRRDARRRQRGGVPDARRDGRRGERRPRQALRRPGRHPPLRHRRPPGGGEDRHRGARRRSRHRTRGSSASPRPRTAPRRRSRSPCSSRAAGRAAAARRRSPGGSWRSTSAWPARGEPLGNALGYCLARFRAP